jgi:hypothetical protein
LEFVEEGNAVLIKTVKGFGGSTAAEFRRQLERSVESWCAALLEHPVWARERTDRIIGRAIS